MSIAITLPAHLWECMISGKKSIELRKNFPTKFDLNEDVVFVIIKGTHQVAGWFRVRDFEKVTDVSQISSNPPEEICVSPIWVRTYLRSADKCYLWHIKEIHMFDDCKDSNFYLNLRSNPQSFIYV